MRTQLFTAVACLSTIGSTALSQQTSEVHQEAHIQDVQNETFIRVNTLLWNGDFIVDVQRLSEQEVIRIHLEGTMWDVEQTKDGLPTDSWDASIEFNLPMTELDLMSMGSVRALQANSTTQLYSAEPLAPNAALWMSMTNKILGSIEVWNAVDAEFQLSDSAVISLLHTMVIKDGAGNEAQTGQVDCTPTFSECVTTAKDLCGEQDVATFGYRCNQTTGEASCEFTCENETVPPADDPTEP